jgi:hypothetical protein|tara:strand:+ start:97 stop:297 length:201 start_codon:yes stop_codon:yes gene_type:complete
MPHPLKNEIDAVFAAVDQLHHHLSADRSGVARDRLNDEISFTLAGVALEAVGDLKRAAQGAVVRAA